MTIPDSIFYTVCTLSCLLVLNITASKSRHSLSSPPDHFRPLPNVTIPHPLSPKTPLFFPSPPSHSPTPPLQFERSSSLPLLPLRLSAFTFIPNLPTAYFLPKLAFFISPFLPLQSSILIFSLHFLRVLDTPSIIHHVCVPLHPPSPTATPPTTPSACCPDAFPQPPWPYSPRPQNGPAECSASIPWSQEHAGTCGSPSGDGLPGQIRSRSLL